MKSQNIATYSVLATTILLISCGNPEGISDSDYRTYKELGAPKILYSCATQKPMMMDTRLPDCLKLMNESLSKPNAEIVDCSEYMQATMDWKKGEKVKSIGFIAGEGFNATYNHILNEAKSSCTGDFEIIESMQ